MQQDLVYLLQNHCHPLKDLDRALEALEWVHIPAGPETDHVVVTKGGVVMRP